MITLTGGSIIITLVVFLWVFPVETLGFNDTEGLSHDLDWAKKDEERKLYRVTSRYIARITVQVEDTGPINPFVPRMSMIHPRKL